MNDVQTDPRTQAVLEQVQVVENRLQVYVGQGGALVLATPEQYRTAGEELVRIMAAKKTVEETRKAMTRPLDAAKTAIMDFFRAPADRLADAERRIKDAMRTYDAEQERRAREKQRELDEQAERERRFLEQRAARAAESGATDTAQELQQQAAVVAAPVVQAATPSVKGVSYRDAWRFEIVDEAAIPREYLLVDQSKIRRVVEAMKGSASIPGVRVWKDKIVAAGSR